MKPIIIGKLTIIDKALEILGTEHQPNTIVVGDNYLFITASLKMTFQHFKPRLTRAGRGWNLPVQTRPVLASLAEWDFVQFRINAVLTPIWLSLVYSGDNLSGTWGFYYFDIDWMHLMDYVIIGRRTLA